jgi:subfamily B ATP-binding cassette protein MsbA
VEEEQIEIALKQKDKKTLFMFKSLIKRLKIYLILVRLKRFFHKIEVKPTFLLLPVLLAALASIFEGVSLCLLIPTIRGIIQTDFSFIREIPVLKDIIEAFPQIFTIGNTPLFVFLVILIFLSAFLKNVFQYFSSLSMLFLVRQFANNMRKRVYERYLGFGKLFFDQKNAGYLYQVLIGHTTLIAAKLNELKGIFYLLFTLIVYFALMLIISWKLAIFATIIFPILHLSLRWLIRKIRKTSVYFARSCSRLSERISNTLSCIPLIKAQTNEDQEKERFIYASNDLERVEFSMDKKRLLLAPMHEIILLCMMLLLVAATAFLFIRERSGELAGYMVFFVLLRRSMSSFGVFNRIQATLASAKGPIVEVLKIFDNKDKYFVAEGPKEFKGLKKSIEFNHMSFSFPNRKEILKDINLVIPKGKITALVGLSGAGKTTLINLIMRFYDSSPGSIKIDGVDIRGFSLKSLRSKMALVSQETLLFNASLRDNITYGLDRKIADEEIIEAVKKARLYDFIMRLPKSLETVIGDRGVKLSGGEKQRTAITRAILKRTEILMLDEATSALDSRTERLIREAIKQLIRDKTTIIIAHRLSTIKHADKIVVIEDGRLIEEGRLEELLAKKESFYRYWEEQKFY